MGCSELFGGAGLCRPHPIDIHQAWHPLHWFTLPPGRLTGCPLGRVDPVGGFAKEAAGTGVTVNSVIAGPTHTGGVEKFVYELVDPALPWDEAQREFMRLHRPQSLLQRLIEPEEIANMVAYLCSPLASATTGAAVRVDGGYVDSILP